MISVIINLLLAITVVKQVFTNNIQAIELIQKDNTIKLLNEELCDDMNDYIHIVEHLQKKEEVQEKKKAWRPKWSKNIPKK